MKHKLLSPYTQLSAETSPTLTTLSQALLNLPSVKGLWLSDFPISMALEAVPGYDVRKVLSIGTPRTGLPRWHSDKEPACQCRSLRRHGFYPGVWKIPWRRKWQPPPVFLLGQSYGGPQSTGSPRVGHN